MKFFVWEKFKLFPTNKTIQPFQTHKTLSLNTQNIMSRDTNTYSASSQKNFTANSDPAKGISLCIPRVHANINWRRIKQHIIDAQLGFVDRVDVPQKTFRGKDGRLYRKAFVHFAPNRWNMRDATARNALTQLQAGKRIKLEYEAPWFWLAGISGAVRPDDAPKRPERKTRIDLSASAATPKQETKEEPANYDLSAQQDEEHSGVNLNDPITARAAENVRNSPKSAEVEDGEVEEGEVSYERD